MLPIDRFSQRFTVRQLISDDIERILSVYQSNPLYFKHCPPEPTLSLVLEDMSALPKGKKAEDKYFLGYFEGENLIAVLDLIQAYPDDATAFIGFFMLDKAAQGTGMGSFIITELLDVLRSHFDKVRLGFVKGNPQAEHFWRKQGIVPTGQIVHDKKYDIVVAEKSLR